MIRLFQEGCLRRLSWWAGSLQSDFPRYNREYRDRLEAKIGFLDLAADFNTRGHRRGRDRRTGPMPRIASPLPCWCPLRFITSLFIDVTDGTFYHYNSRKASSLASPLSPIPDAFPPTSAALVVQLISSVLILDPSFLPVQTTLCKSMPER
ncbi:hypothetical protein HZH68_004261 [Vespula germanica]|uniref:Uncharacterized protein n=1 Tax=Vespula germanica TaxID=30212 RepID=A0A834NI37_VESGE|nr:hypothetical protein HZH68_004261 [Vespula germanica]